MKWFLCMTAVLAFTAAASAAMGDTFVVVNNVTTAQQDAERMARTGILRHCGTAGGRREGIAFSTVSAQAAQEACCFYRDAMRGRYRIVERGVARGPRGWYAVIRYE
jgi:hypothetical protein